MTNILPQTATMNRGAWRHTEDIVECYRDFDEILVLGGVLWGDKTVNDHFRGSHGIRTPDAYWKVLVRGNGDSIAWIIRNSEYATYRRLDNYLVSVREIENVLAGEIPVVPDYRKDEIPETSWSIPIGCERG